MPLLAAERNKFDEHDKPHLTFEKEDFSLSEAASIVWQAKSCSLRTRPERPWPRQEQRIPQRMVAS
jgi:hypothetical protein